MLYVKQENRTLRNRQHVPLSRECFFSKTKVCKSFSSFDFYASHVSASSLYFCPTLGLSQPYYVIVSRLMLGIAIVLLCCC